MIVTAAIPAALLADANHLAMCLGFSEADGETYRGMNWVDAAGNLYAAASFAARPEWIAHAQEALLRPVWDTEKTVNVAGAKRAQAALIFSLDPVLATPTAITVRGGPEGLPALLEMGLVPAPEPL